MSNQIAPVVVLLAGALLILGGTKLSRRGGLPGAFGCGVALCIIAIGVWVSPADWRDWWAGGSGGDRLNFVRIAGLTGMFFIAGTRFDSTQLQDTLKQMFWLGLAGAVLFATVVLSLKLLGWQSFGPIFLVAGTVVAGSPWFFGQQSRAHKEDKEHADAAALVLTAVGLLAVYFFDVFEVIGRARPGTTVFLIVGLYESLKLIVFFAFAYFISSRFLRRAEGRISAIRTNIGFVLLAILLFALAAITTNHLIAVAWAFVAGALWRGTEIGKTFSESNKPVGSAVLLSFVFVSAMLQSHGRIVTSFSILIVAVLAVTVLKSVFVWLGARMGRTSARVAIRTVAAMVGPGEVAILLLGFGMTRWVIDAPVYFGMFGYALLSLLLTPLVCHFATVDRETVVMSRRPVMKGQMKRILCLLIASLSILLLSSRTSIAQQPSAPSTRQEIKLGSGMSVITPGLMEIGSKTKLFLLFADKIPVTVDQRKKLEGLFLEIQMYGVQRAADLDVADAELKRLLTRDTVDLDNLKAKMKEIEAIRVEMDIKKIETLLQAINTLTHEQHTRIILLARDLEEANKPRAPIYQ